MVADALVYHPAISHYLRFVATTVGRDKVLRLVQYFARFYAWYLYRTNQPTRAIAPWNAVKKQFGLIRKGLRLGKNVEHFKAAATAYDSQNIDPIIKYATVGRQLGYAGYLSLDMLTFLDSAGIRPSASAKRIQLEAYRSWMVGLLCSAASSVYTLYQLRNREQSIDRKEGEGVVEIKKLQRERTQARKQLISDLCDLAVPTSALGYTNFDDGFIGLTGTVSSVIGLLAAWQKTA